MSQDGKPWSPYLAGALSGLVSIGSVWVAGKYFGASTTFVRSAAGIEQIYAPERVAQMEYFIKEAAKLDWQGMFLIGILVGALIAAFSDGSFRSQTLPPLWQDRFGSNIALRGIIAFIGGTVAMFGARMANG